MASILIVLDQPAYMSSQDFIATPSACVNTIFSGDIVKENMSALSKVRGRRFDTILLPATITEESSDYEDIRDFVSSIKSPETKVHRYENQY